MAVFLLWNENDIVNKISTKKKQEIARAAEEVGNPVNVVKSTTKNRGQKKPKSKVPTNKNQYTPSNKWYGSSYEDTKTKLKIYYEHHPESHAKFIQDLAENAGTSPKWAALVVAMTGGTDPTETKITGEVTQVAESPLNSLTIEELKSLKALKMSQNEAKKEGKWTKR